MSGKFDDFSGRSTSTAPASASSVEFNIKAASVDTGNADRDKHLQTADSSTWPAAPSMQIADEPSLVGTSSCSERELGAAGHVEEIGGLQMLVGSALPVSTMRLMLNSRRRRRLGAVDVSCR